MKAGLPMSSYSLIRIAKNVASRTFIVCGFVPFVKEVHIAPFKKGLDYDNNDSNRSAGWSFMST